MRDASPQFFDRCLSSASRMGNICKYENNICQLEFTFTDAVMAGKVSRMEVELDSLASRIRQGMALRRIYASQIARHIGVSRAAVSQWVRGESEPSSAKLRAVADFLDLNLEWLGQGIGPIAREERRIIVADGEKIDPRYMPDDLRPLLRGRREVWRIESSAMMGAGYRPGDYALVDLAANPKARDIVLAEHNKTPVFRLFLPPYLYGATIGGQQPEPLVVDNISCTILGVVISRHSAS